MAQLSSGRKPDELHPLARAWRDRGRLLDGPSGHVFVVDEPAAGKPDGPPILLLHGFPTCSFDWRHVWPQLNANRRLVALDFPGFGLSVKLSRPHTIESQADAVIAVIEQLGIDEVDLVTHDMGDTVGGALLARDIDPAPHGPLPFRVRRRVVTNGSIYIDMAKLRWQQKLLLRLPNRSFPIALPSGVLYRRGVADTFGETPADVHELAALWDLYSHDKGDRLAPRLIRYIEERRTTEHRWTGAIETHPSPLTIVWAESDPVAVPGMAERLADARQDADVTWLRGVGHFPMIEAPDAFADAVLTALAV